MAFWEWVDKHGAAVAAAGTSVVTFIGAVVIAYLLWDRIGDVGEDVRNLSSEIRTLQTQAHDDRNSDIGRIDNIGARLDATVARLDQILDESRKNSDTLASLSASTNTQNERLAAVESIVATGATDMSVVLRLLSGDTPQFSLTNFATKTHKSIAAQAGISTVMVAAKLFRAGELRLYPPNPSIANILRNNGWVPVSDDPAEGYVFKP